MLHGIVEGNKGNRRNSNLKKSGTTPRKQETVLDVVDELDGW